MSTMTATSMNTSDPDSGEQPGSSTPGRHHLHFSRTLRRKALPAAATRWLRRQLLACADVLGVTLVELSIVIVHDDRMSDLHLRYCGIEGTTDVLTFDLSDEPAADRVEGEIYICLDEAARQAEARRHDVQHELLLYALHGVLHLMGYDDHDPADHAAMHAEEDRVLEAIGVGRVFGR